MFKLLLLVSFAGLCWVRGSNGQTNERCSPHGIVPGSPSEPVNGTCECRHPTRDVEEHISSLCEPFVHHNYPKYGAQSNSADMYILGVYLNDSGRYQNETLTVTFTETGWQLNVLYRNDTLILVQVPPLPDDSWLNKELSMKVVLPDGDVVKHKGSLSFAYQPDPIIHKVVPGKSIMVGGIPQTITGENFNSTVTVVMRILMVYHDTTEYFPPQPTQKELCDVKNSTLMLCTTPTVPLGHLPTEYRNKVRRKRQAEPATEVVFYINRPHQRFNFHVVFNMGLLALGTNRNATHREWGEHEDTVLYMYDDPVIYPWGDEPYIFRVYKGETELLIEGRKFLYGGSTEEKDYSITVGSEVCKIKKMYHNSIRCIPPAQQPQDTDFHHKGNPRVLLEVGKLRVTVGYVQYYMKWMDEPTYYYCVVAGIPAVVVFLILLVLGVVAIRRFLRAYRIVKIDAKSKTDILKRLPPTLRTSVKESRIDNKLIKKGRELGKGNFGLVFLGQKLKRPNDRQSEEVAIKTIKEGDRDITQVKEFLEEGLMMKGYNHPNVLPLVGIAFEGNMPMIVLPFMEHGDLRQFIKNPNNRLTGRDLVCFGYQVASGMNYLSAGPNVKPLVHRDLAARNCMIDRAQVVKIADFGLARDLHGGDYYVTHNTRPMPIKWMSPEAIHNCKYTTKSDVWSFGVLLWELLTRGARPYAQVGNRELQGKLSCGYRLEKPAMCTDIVYQVMTDCWMELPNDRPDFASLQHDLGYILETCGVTIQASVPPTPLNQKLSQNSPDYDIPVPACDDVSIRTATTYGVSLRSGLSSRQTSQEGFGDDVTGTYIDSKLLPPTASVSNPSYDPQGPYLQPMPSVTAPNPPAFSGSQPDGYVNGSLPPENSKQQDNGNYVTALSCSGRAPPVDQRDVHIGMDPMMRPAAGRHPNYDVPVGATKDYVNSVAGQPQYGGQQQQQGGGNHNAGYTHGW